MEATIRLAIFAAIVAIVALLERRLPKRPRTVDWKRRWAINASIFAMDVVVQRLTIGAAAFATALYAEAHGWGLFNSLDWPFWLEAILAFLILDFAIYLQHVLVACAPDLLAIASGPPRGPRCRSDHGHALSPDRDPRVDDLQSGARRGDGCRPLGRHRLRGRSQRIFGVHARQHPPAGAARSRAALRRLHARHAPRPPFDHTERDRHEFRFLPLDLGRRVRNDAARTSARRGNSASSSASPSSATPRTCRSGKILVMPFRYLVVAIRSGERVDRAHTLARAAVANHHWQSCKTFAC